MQIDVDALRFDAQGLIPAVVQERSTGEVLMVAYMNRESLEKTLATGFTWFYSRSRGRLWQKGEQSGHVQKVHSVSVDCDGDALLVQVTQEGPGACHTGHRTCFYRDVYAASKAGGADGSGPEKAFDPEKVYSREDGSGILAELHGVIAERKAHPKEGSYTTYLFNEGINKILKKVGEEAAEVIIAAKDPEDDPLIYEAADLLYHLLVLLVERNIAPDAVFSELRRRRPGSSAHS
ncbi:MAG: bifunctional phosphoribosyl-AMP cyclohydrolase/phosphoribosyl-ATP diphosphatase HisIE [Firmicutes bacterium]|jgi:phosphoribosyl-ATP pyrophosphohydrolase/phosphoribosyl-AMP cyclohydrolase|nr:bifunctional phosphoribosyl-AMP cyclohydrolase/phosphoribosyl-ATP diphosphatase HisIE [Bacillota bacterium]